jgi:predicted RNase H-like HicB family nuclease
LFSILRCDNIYYMKKIYSKKLPVKTKYGSFVCVFESESDMGGYAVEAVKVQGAVSWGKNLAEAKRMITEAIEGIMDAQTIIEAERQGTISINTGPVNTLA